MKRKTFLALAVVGVVGSSAASAGTYLCQTDPSDVSFKSCIEVAYEARTGTNVMLVPALPAVSTSSVDQVREQIGRERNASLHGAIPGPVITTYDYSGVWPETEPSITRYQYYTLDSAQ